MSAIYDRSSPRTCTISTRRGHTKRAQLTPTQADAQPPHVINLVDHHVRRKPILDELTSEYQIAA
jgi:hypothetical protein